MDNDLLCKTTRERRGLAFSCMGGGGVSEKSYFLIFTARGRVPKPDMVKTT